MGGIKTVAVIGLGTLGAQIALQSAAKGYDVVGYDPVEGALENYLQHMPVRISPEDGQPLFDTAGWIHSQDKIRVHTDLPSAVTGADLIIESVPENLELKREVWRKLDALAPQGSILATNSSSMPVSRLEAVTGRPQLCLNMHFYQIVLGQKMADIMGGSRTDPGVLECGGEFVRSLGIVPLKVNKELLGFCFNRIWRAIKKEALQMWAGGYVDFRDIDRAYMVFNSTSWGPFSLMDTVGLDVIWDIEMVYFRESGEPGDHPPQALKDKIKAGELGVKTGSGFYSYPDPEFLAPHFLNPNSVSEK